MKSPLLDLTMYNQDQTIRELGFSDAVRQHLAEARELIILPFEILDQYNLL